MGYKDQHLFAGADGYAICIVKPQAASLALSERVVL
jgi:hypothetical protein